MLEADIEKYLVKRVKEIGGVPYKFTSPAHRGVPDRLCVLPCGKIAFVEVKREGGVISKLQQAEHNTLRNLGHMVLVVWNKQEVDEAIEIMKEEIYGQHA